ncbi:hypothetical protein HDU76_007535 [Blyttiomyces sp. JEL0837]|nr:hypothetical protein HDU76_007535 [Blyttiomyces sp. JEL0837]
MFSTIFKTLGEVGSIFTPSFLKSKNYSLDAIPNLDGKVAIVTGSSSGLGLTSALAMAKKGCHVLASVKKFAKEFSDLKLPIHILMNNAGIMALPTFQLSKDGIELQLASNHLGHFYLTQLLLPIIKETARKDGSETNSIRIVNVSSFGHNFAPAQGIDFDGFNDATKYSPYVAYGQSKLANILFTDELQRRLAADSPTLPIKVNSIHPGGVNTNLTSAAAYASTWMNFILSPVEEGSLTQLYAATSPEIDSKGYKGEYFVPVALLGNKSVLAKDEGGVLGKKLWEWSEKVVAEKGFDSKL